MPSFQTISFNGIWLLPCCSYSNKKCQWGLRFLWVTTENWRRKTNFWVRRRIFESLLNLIRAFPPCIKCDDLLGEIVFKLQQLHAMLSNMVISVFWVNLGWIVWYFHLVPKTTLCMHAYVCVYIYLSVCLSICLSVYLSICLFVYLSICLSVCLSVYLSICLSVGLSVYLFICLPIYLSIYPSIYLSIYLIYPIHPFYQFYPIYPVYPIYISILSIFLSNCLSVCLSIYRSFFLIYLIYPSICLSVYLSIYRSVCVRMRTYIQVVSMVPSKIGCSGTVAVF